MPDPKFVKPWHGIPREQIKWHPSVDEDACIGCGTCVQVAIDWSIGTTIIERKIVVEDPLYCLVGCVTCGNTCPTHAISFPQLDTITSLLSKPEVHHEDKVMTCI